jgi:hypothetical protein
MGQCYPGSGDDRTTTRMGPAKHAWIVGGSLFTTIVIVVRMFRLFSDYRVLALATTLPWGIALSVSPLFRDQARVWLTRQLGLAERFARHGGAVPWGLALVFVAWPAWLFWLAHGVIFGSVDTRPAVVSSISLARHATLDLSALSRDFSTLPVSLRVEIPGVPRPGFERRGSRIYSAFPMGMIPLAFPLALTAELARADLTSAPVQYRFEKMAATTITAIACGLFFLVVLRLSQLRVAAAATLLLVLGSVIWTVMAAGLWQHGGVFLWSMVFLLVELLPPETGDGRRRGTFVALGIQGFVGTQLLLCRPTAALFVAFLNLWVLTRSRFRGLILGLINLFSLFAVLGFNLWLFGDLRGPYYIRTNSAAHNWHLTAESLLGILFSPARGLFVFQPWLLVLLPLSLLELARCSDRGRREFLPIAGLVLAHTLLIAAWQDWIGGWCWGSRLLAETVPLWMLLGLSGLKRLLSHLRGPIVLGGVLIISFSIHAVTALVPPAAWHSRFQPVAGNPIIWSVRDSPVAFAVREGLRR